MMICEAEVEGVRLGIEGEVGEADEVLVESREEQG